MSKIAIVTFHKACNYGAFLQAFALQETLNQYPDTEAYILDYGSEMIDERYTPSYCLKRKGNLIKKICKYIMDYQDINKRNNVFAQSREKYFRIEAKNVTRDQLGQIVDNYQAVITGSDQVWNREIIKDDNTFFLDFVKPHQKKYSYAASIGKSFLNQDQLQDMTEMLHDYNRISVREPDIVPEFERCSEFPPVVCTLDPVFLYKAKDWRKFSEYKARKPYILFFMMGQSGNALPAMNFARKYANEKKWDVVFLSDNERWYKYRDLNHFGVATPAEFVGLIDHAECVITNSFHATAFSIILHTNFYVETQVLRNNRIVNLLNSVALEERGLIKGKPQDVKNAIDWNDVDKKIQPLIQKSHEYLDEIVSDLKEETLTK